MHTSLLRNRLYDTPAVMLSNSIGCLPSGFTHSKTFVFTLSQPNKQPIGELLKKKVRIFEFLLPKRDMIHLTCAFHQLLPKINDHRRTHSLHNDARSTSHTSKLCEFIDGSVWWIHILSGIWWLLQKNGEHTCVDLLHTKQINMQLRPYITSGLNSMSRIAQKPMEHPPVRVDLSSLWEREELFDWHLQRVCQHNLGKYPPKKNWNYFTNCWWRLGIFEK